MDQFSFYHGTSTLFLPSIMQYGIGAVNPSKEWRTLELLQFLVDICEKKLQSHVDYERFQKTSLAMANQESFLNNNPEINRLQEVHFQHDQIYFALSEFRAVIYAASNKSGSELVERCLLLYKILKKNNIPVNIPSQLNKQIQLDVIVNSLIYPVLIEVNNIPFNYFETDNGIDGVSFFKDLNERMSSWTEEEKFYEFQLLNFRLLKPIPKEMFKVYELEHNNRFGGSVFRYEKRKIYGR